MNNIFTRSVLMLVLFTPWVNASVDGSGDNCNATEGLDGWAIWCGVDTYLAQQEPTAAGPIEGGFEGVVEPDIRTVAFGGSLLDTPPVTEPEIEYNWQGYAMLMHPDFGGLQAGELKLKVDTVTGEVIGLLTTASGQEVVFNEGAKFYVAQELIPLIDIEWPLSDYSGEAGVEQISQFEVASEGSLLKLVTFPQGWVFSAVGNGFDPEHSSVSTIGQINDGEIAFGNFVAGSLTPLDRMADFVSQGRIANYSGYGMYSGIGYVANDITVDFGEATWSGGWGGELNIDAQGVVTGNQFSSNVLTSQSATITGSINGSFNGNNATTLTGVLDVIKGGEQSIVGTFKNVMHSESESSLFNDMASFE